MPAAAVIPAPIAYIKVVAVKKLVVGHEVGGRGRPEGWTVCRCLLVGGFVCESRQGTPTGYCEEIRVFKAGKSLNRSAWNNKRDMGQLVG